MMMNQKVAYHSPAIESDWDDHDSEDDSGNDNETGVPFQFLSFQVLVSHVCRRWREVALGAHILWTTIEFGRPTRLDWARMYIARSGELRLSISIYCTLPKGVNDADLPDHPLYYENKDLQKMSIREALVAEHGEEYASKADEMDNGDDDDNGTLFLLRHELGQILDLIEPTVSRWGAFEFQASTYSYTHLLISRLHALPSAPLLETFRVYDFRDCDDYQVFDGEKKTSFLPFHGDAPLLKKSHYGGCALTGTPRFPRFCVGCAFSIYTSRKKIRHTRPSHRSSTTRLTWSLSV